VLPLTPTVATRGECLDRGASSGRVVAEARLTLTARSEIISLAKRTAVVRIDVHNGGRLAGAAQGTVAITQPR